VAHASLRDPGDHRAEREADRTIAGEKATCFSLQTPRPSGHDPVLCFSREGALLLTETEQEGRVPALRWEATDVSAEVPEGIFEPPYEVVGESELCQSGVFEC
jgi:hypothetical protein